MRWHAHRGLLRLFKRLPRPARARLVRWGAPTFQVGALCLVERPDGKVLLVRDVYRDGWGLPGGLLKRREQPAAAARREVQEEIGLHLDLDPSPTVVVDPRARRVDIVYRAMLPTGGDEPSPRSAEIVEIGWFRLDGLPVLHREATSALTELARRRLAPPGA